MASAFVNWELYPDQEDDCDFSEWLDMTVAAGDVEVDLSFDLDARQQPRYTADTQDNMGGKPEDTLTGSDRERQEDAGDGEGGGSPMVISPRNRSPELDALSSSVKGLKEIGACWSCQFLGQKCDPETPCKACRELEDRTSWTALDCRRGPLSQQMPPILLCPNALVDNKQDGVPATAQLQLCSQLLRTTEAILEEAAQRLRIVLAGPNDSLHKLILQALCPPPRMVSTAQPGRSTPEGQRTLDERPILRIIWALLDNPAAKITIGVESIDELADLLNSADTYETECTDSRFPLISTSIMCLLRGAETLRLHHAGLLAPYAHKFCHHGKCQLRCVDDLTSAINKYVELFSNTILDKEKTIGNWRWWLSCFYSLCIQSYVRPALVAIEAQLNVQPISHSDTNARNSGLNEYGYVMIQLFAAASEAFDPIGSDWSIENPPEPLRSEPGLLKHLRQAQKVVQSKRWKESGILCSHRYLEREFGVPQKAFPAQGVDDIGGAHVQMLALAHSNEKRSSSKRRANSPPTETLARPLIGTSAEQSLNTVQVADQPSITGNSSGIPPPLPLSKPIWMSSIQPSRLPTARRARSSSDALVKPQVPSRNTSPAGRLPFKPMPSPISIGTLPRNASNDSLSGLNMNGWSLASQGSMSPSSAYSNEGYLSYDAAPPIPRHMSFGSNSPHAPGSRRASGSGYTSDLQSQLSVSKSIDPRHRAVSSARQGFNSEEDDTFLAQSRRRMSNRAAQRAFRERQERQIKELESKVADLEAAQLKATGENESQMLEEGKATQSHVHALPNASTARLPPDGIGSTQHANALSAAAISRQPVQPSSAAKLESSRMKDHESFLICSCCPKTPKTFQTQEELRAHEAEKQYECTFCGNRFKNKNEAERHQKALHLRSHSWTCSALVGYEKAFFDSHDRPGLADACGYCGEEFPRSGPAQLQNEPSAASPNLVTDEDGEERMSHLQDVHKFRECNLAKKFFRADHFRQHIKHVHAAVTGNWTNYLEMACMVEHEPALPLS